MKNTIYVKMFLWLFVGLLITFGVGYILSIKPEFLISLATIGIIPIIIIELVISVVMGLCLKKLPEIVMKIMYLLFCTLTGLTFGFIFISYKIDSVMSLFVISALIFALLAFYGYITKRDLSRFGTILLFMLLGLIIGEIINFSFFHSSQTEVLFSAIGVGVFTMYIAYDTNKVKLMLPEYGENKAAIYGAYQLYLDFINLFIKLLELFGKRND